MQSAGPKKLALLTVLGAFLSLVFVFMGAPFLRLIRNIYGAKTFWGVGLFLFVVLLVSGLFPMGYLLFSCWLVVGIYTELEEKGHASFWSAAFAILISSAFLVGGTYYTAKAYGVNIQDDIQKSVDVLLSQFKEQAKDSSGKASEEAPTLLSGLHVDANLVLSQIPSIVIVLFTICLAYGLMLERKTALFFNLQHEWISSQLKLLEFRVPDAFIWIAMLSFLGSFVKLNNQGLAIFAMNVFNVMLGLYFFQGLAVTEVLMRIFRAGPVLRFLVYFVVVFQLFFILSAVGFIDYWVDVRRRLKNLREKRRKQNNGEHV